MTGIGNAGGIEAAPGYRPQQSDQEGTEGKPKLESVEKQPEVSEAAQSVERATFKPEEKVETERSVQESEDLEEAFSAAMEEPKPAEAAHATEDGGRRTEGAAEAAAEEGQETGDRVEAVKQAASSEGAAPRTAESAASSAEDLAEAVAERSEPEVEMAAESAPPVSQAAETADRTAPAVSLDGLEDDKSGMVIVGPDGEPVGSTFDDGQGIEQPGDIRQPSKDGGVADLLGDANRTEAEGQMGVVDAEGIDPIEGAAVPDLMGGRDGMGFGDLEGGPDIGLNQQGELDGLRDVAAFGADSRVGWTGVTSMSDSMSSDGSQVIEGSEHYEMDDGSSMDVTTTHNDGITTETITHTDADGNTTTETTTMGGEEGSKTESGNTNDGNTAGGGQRTRPTNDIRDGLPKNPTETIGQSSYDPEGDTGTTPTNDDEVEVYLRQSGLPRQSPIHTDLSSSMSQPADDESGNRPVPFEYDRSSQVDPYAQYTGEETASGAGAIGDLDADGSLVDPPSGVSGGETGNQPPPSEGGGPGVNPNLPVAGPATDDAEVEISTESGRQMDSIKEIDPEALLDGVGNQEEESPPDLDDKDSLNPNIPDIDFGNTEETGYMYPPGYDPIDGDSNYYDSDLGFRVFIVDGIKYYFDIETFSWKLADFYVPDEPGNQPADNYVDDTEGAQVGVDLSGANLPGSEGDNLNKNLNQWRDRDPNDPDDTEINRPEEESGVTENGEHVLPGLEDPVLEDKEGGEEGDVWTNMPLASDYYHPGGTSLGDRPYFDETAYNRDMAEWRSQFESKGDALRAEEIESEEQTEELRERIERYEQLSSQLAAEISRLTSALADWPDDPGYSLMIQVPVFGEQTGSTLPSFSMRSEEISSPEEAAYAISELQYIREAIVQRIPGPAWDKVLEYRALRGYQDLD